MHFLLADDLVTIGILVGAILIGDMNVIRVRAHDPVLLLEGVWGQMVYQMVVAMAARVDAWSRAVVLVVRHRLSTVRDAGFLGVVDRGVRTL